ncbi:AaceriAER311Wp [[Ashbya] aceris (nom. inval.)]|nr:AaceriAER311Wp [[Ashbya] aceris (nom. inval.)]
MEYLALSPVQFSITCLNTGQRSPTLYVRASPKSSVSRLLQYVHWLSCIRENMALGPPEQYCLKYQQRPLELTMLCEEVAGGSGGLVHLELDVRSGCEADTLNLAYDGDSEFAYANVKFQVNTLSMDKVVAVVKQRVSLKTSVLELRTMACEILNEYERSSCKNICSNKNHVPSDMLAFQVAGRSYPVYIGSEDAEEHAGLNLQELLGFDFAPIPFSHCSIMFRTNHGQDGDGVTIEFVSDSALAMKTMKVTVDTTVQEVKEFICSVYGHTLLLSPSDVKLIYSGQLVQDQNNRGEPIKILEYITDSEHTKLHVKVSEEFREPGPGFWSELFTNPERFSFNLSRSRPTVTTSDAGRAAIIPDGPARRQSLSGAVIPQASSSLLSTEMLASSSPDNSMSTRTTPQPPRYVTERGEKLERTGELYERVEVDGSSFFVAKEEFDETINEISVSGHTLRISADQCRIVDNRLFLRPTVVQKLEQILGTTVQRQRVSLIQAAPPITDRFAGEGLRQDVPQPVVSRSAGLRNLLRTVGYTIYLLFYELAFWVFIMYMFEVNSYPLTFCSLTLAFFLVGFARSSNKLIDTWTDYFFGKNASINDAERANLRRIAAGELDHRFFGRFHASASFHIILDALSQRLTADPDLRNALCATYHLNPNLSSRVALARILRRCASYEYRTADCQPLKQLFDGLLRNVLHNLDAPHTLPAPELVVYKELRIYHYKQQIFRTYRTAADLADRLAILYEFCSGGLMRRVATDPEKDNIVVATFKSLALAFLLFFPTFQLQFDEIMSERTIDRQAAQAGPPADAGLREPDNDQAHVEQLEPLLGPATGIQLHPDD